MSDVDAHATEPQPPYAGQPWSPPPATVPEPFFAPRPPRRRWPLIAAGAGVVVLLAVIAFVVFGGSGTLTVRGSISVVSTDDILSPITKGAPCFESGGFDDIKGGAQVVITDAAGKTLAVGELSPGVGVGDQILTSCQFSFSVPGVRKGAGPYGFQVGNRKAYVFAEKDAGDLQLSLGG